MRKSLLLLVLLSGCATHPITGRNQIQALPAVQAAYAEVGFVMSTEAVAIELARGITHARLPGGDWSARYLGSAQHVARIAAGPPPGSGVYFAKGTLK